MTARSASRISRACAWTHGFWMCSGFLLFVAMSILYHGSRTVLQDAHAKHLVFQIVTAPPSDAPHFGSLGAAAGASPALQSAAPTRLLAGVRLPQRPSPLTPMRPHPASPAPRPPPPPHKTRRGANSSRCPAPRSDSALPRLPLGPILPDSICQAFCASGMLEHRNVLQAGVART